MRAFDFAAPRGIAGALRLAGDGSAFLAGGTTLVDLMKLNVLAPEHVIDINRLPLRGIRLGPDGLHIGALERMDDIARHGAVAAQYPLISQALLLSASPQIRNMASIGGNLMQRTRCGYFRDMATSCNKRSPGSGCPAQTGDNRGHAVLGTSASCAATHASDVAVALVALDASVRLRGRDGERSVRLADFYLLPGDTPHVENRLRPGELITEVIVPRLQWARHSTYVKVRDRQSYEFALASAAVAVDLRGGKVRDARVAVGGVGTVPWRLPAVEAALRAGQSFERASALAAEGARPLAGNSFKVELVQRTVLRALMEVAGSR
ncbi:xanthine dehydrogenase family protein subunit M [Planotetraspora sp. A-T 1434]|uniref:FAD binding domain-containing protein n=1 Tax=Planotetraspora sp. A-T 1434 TaxID=2979219 RepID=UPI0021C09AB4|nr:xanthine dehydrogenase family protein subunit M [Planotetraspora sp. A-T 1434]MCT9929835.1 xanthine dehydrogenase family protein subunit M [Planotetraspora sp. A-T 1434]